MTVKEHIKEYIRNCPHGFFWTSDIQDLARHGITEYGRWLGSPSTYERIFRTLKSNREINVIKTRRPGTKQLAWRIEENE